MRLDSEITTDLMEKISKAIESAMIEKAGHYICYPTRSQDFTEICREAYKMINFEKVKKQIAVELEKNMAERIVANIATEFGSDIKKMMSNAVIRKDLQDWLQIQVADLLKRVGDNNGFRQKQCINQR